MTNPHKLVEEGGIYIECTECKQTVAIEKDDLSDYIRGEMAIEAPLPCTLSFNKCTEHIELEIEFPKE